MKNFIKRFFVVLCICVIGVTGFSYAENSALTKATNGVVRIVVEDSNGNFYQTTGFAIGKKGKPVTAFITSGSMVKDSKSVKIVIDYIGEGGSFVDASVITASLNPDIAIISIASPVDKWIPLPLGSATKVEKSQPVFQLGFTEEESKVDFSKDKFKSTSEEVVMTQMIVSKENIDIGGVKYIQTETAQKYGYYGGPLVDSKGNVVGINTHNPQDKVSIAIHADYLFNLLDNNSIAYSKVSSLPIIPIAIGAAVLIVVIVIIAVVSSQKSSKAPAKGSQRASGNDMNKTVAINPQVNIPHNNKPATDSTLPQIIGKSGYFTSKKFSVKDKLIIGRDPKRAKIIFPDKTKGVSAVHMEIRNIDGSLQIVDLGSTYGTFLSDGTKLNSTVPYVVNKGDEFYLGAKENRFQVL